MVESVAFIVDALLCGKENSVMMEAIIWCRYVYLVGV